MHTPTLSRVVASKAIEESLYILTQFDLTRYQLPSCKSEKGMQLSFINDFPVPKKIPTPKIKQLNNIYKLGNVSSGIFLKFQNRPTLYIGTTDGNLITFDIISQTVVDISLIVNQEITSFYYNQFYETLIIATTYKVFSMRLSTGTRGEIDICPKSIISTEKFPLNMPEQIEESLNKQFAHTIPLCLVQSAKNEIFIVDQQLKIKKLFCHDFQYGHHLYQLGLIIAINEEKIEAFEMNGRCVGSFLSEQKVIGYSAFGHIIAVGAAIKLVEFKYRKHTHHLEFRQVGSALPFGSFDVKAVVFCKEYYLFNCQESVIVYPYSQVEDKRQYLYSGKTGDYNLSSPFNAVNLVQAGLQDTLSLEDKMKGCRTYIRCQKGEERAFEKDYQNKLKILRQYTDKFKSIYSSLGKPELFDQLGFEEQYRQFKDKLDGYEEQFQHETRTLVPDGTFKNCDEIQRNVFKINKEVLYDYFKNNSLDDYFKAQLRTVDAARQAIISDKHQLGVAIRQRVEIDSFDVYEGKARKFEGADIADIKVEKVELFNQAQKDHDQRLDELKKKQEEEEAQKKIDEAFAKKKTEEEKIARIKAEREKAEQEEDEDEPESEETVVDPFADVAEEDEAAKLKKQELKQARLEEKQKRIEQRKTKKLALKEKKAQKEKEKKEQEEKAKKQEEDRLKLEEEKRIKIEEEAKLEAERLKKEEELRVQKEKEEQQRLEKERLAEIERQKQEEERKKKEEQQRLEVEEEKRRQEELEKQRVQTLLGDLEKQRKLLLELQKTAQKLQTADTNLKAKTTKYEKLQEEVSKVLAEIQSKLSKKQQLSDDLKESVENAKIKRDTVKREVRRLMEEMKLDYDNIEDLSNQIIQLKRVQREIEAERKREEEERRKREEAERKSREEAERKRIAEEKRIEEEKRKEEERLRLEEEKRIKEEERKRLEVEKKARQEQERLEREEAKRVKEAEKKAKLEQEKLEQDELERQKKEEAAKKKADLELQKQQKASQEVVEDEFDPLCGAQPKKKKGAKVAASPVPAPVSEEEDPLTSTPAKKKGTAKKKKAAGPLEDEETSVISKARTPAKATELSQFEAFDDPFAERKTVKKAAKKQTPKSPIDEDDEKAESEAVSSIPKKKKVVAVEEESDDEPLRKPVKKAAKKAKMADADPFKFAPKEDEENAEFEDPFNPQFKKKAIVKKTVAIKQESTESEESVEEVKPKKAVKKQAKKETSSEEQESEVVKPKKNPKTASSSEEEYDESDQPLSVPDGQQELPQPVNVQEVIDNPFAPGAPAKKKAAKKAVVKPESQKVEKVEENLQEDPLAKKAVPKKKVVQTVAPQDNGSFIDPFALAPQKTTTPAADKPKKKAPAKKAAAKKEALAVDNPLDPLHEAVHEPVEVEPENQEESSSDDAVSEQKSSSKTSRKSKTPAREPSSVGQELVDGDDPLAFQPKVVKNVVKMEQDEAPKKKKKAPAKKKIQLKKTSSSESEQEEVTDVVSKPKKEEVKAVEKLDEEEDDDFENPFGAELPEKKQVPKKNASMIKSAIADKANQLAGQAKAAMAKVADSLTGQKETDLYVPKDVKPFEFKVEASEESREDKDNVDIQHKFKLKFHDFDLAEVPITLNNVREMIQKSQWAKRILVYQTIKELEQKKKDAISKEILDVLLSHLPTEAIIDDRFIILPSKYKNNTWETLLACYDFQLHDFVSAKQLPGTLAGHQFLRTFRSLRHNNILKFVGYGFCDNTNQLYIVTEQQPVNTLFDALDYDTLFHEIFTDWNCVQYFIWSLCNVITFLNQPNFKLMHRDLRPSTIWIRILPNGKPEAVIYHIGFMQGCDGFEKPELTSMYASPEVVCGGCTMSSDVWSIGTICYVVVAKFLNRSFKKLFCANHVNDPGSVPVHPGEERLSVQQCNNSFTILEQVRVCRDQIPFNGKIVAIKQTYIQDVLVSSKVKGTFHVAYSVACGKLPWEQTFRGFDPIPWSADFVANGCPKIICDFIQSCWVFDQAKRPKAEQQLRHCWFTGEVDQVVQLQLNQSEVVKQVNAQDEVKVSAKAEVKESPTLGNVGRVLTQVVAPIVDDEEEEEDDA